MRVDAVMWLFVSGYWRNLNDTVRCLPYPRTLFDVLSYDVFPVRYAFPYCTVLAVRGMTCTAVIAVSYSSVRRSHGVFRAVRCWPKIIIFTPSGVYQPCTPA